MAVVGPFITKLEDRLRHKLRRLWQILCSRRMQGRELSQKYYRRVLRAQVVLGLASGTTGGVTKIVPESLAAWGPVQQAVIFLQAWAWAIIPLLAIALGLLEATRRALGTPGSWETAHVVLDVMRDKILIPPEPGGSGPQSKQDWSYRVTLFKATRWCLQRYPFFGHWLVPVERSGDSLRQTRCVFEIDPDQPDKAEGVAGRAYFLGGVHVDSLPELGPDSPEEHWDDYANRTFLSLKRLKSAEPPRARSYVAIVIEVDGKKWGSLVLDSVSPETIPFQPKEDLYDIAAKALGKALKG